MSNFQRDGATSNFHVGRVFEERARKILAGIADYTIEAFDIEQARRYRDDLEACFRNLAENPQLGRSAEALAPGLRRLKHRAHAVFYAEDTDGVLIVRILHTRTDAPSPWAVDNERALYRRMRAPSVATCPANPVTKVLKPVNSLNSVYAPSSEGERGDISTDAAE